MPLPVPGDPNDTVIHGVLLVAVRVQLLVLAAIVTSPFPPAAAKLAVFGVSENEHCAPSGDAASKALNASMAKRKKADWFDIGLSIISKTEDKYELFVNTTPILSWSESYSGRRRNCR